MFVSCEVVEEGGGVDGLGLGVSVRFIRRGWFFGEVSWRRRVEDCG